MKIGWFDFWVLFSWFLLLILVIAGIIRIFHWLKFRKELAYIKQQKIQDIVGLSKISNIPIEEYPSELLEFKKEIDYLMKDVYFGLYENNKDDSWPDFDLEESLEKFLDGKILDIIKEKDVLLLQKESLISSLEEKNKKMLKNVVNKMFYLLQEKDKAIKEKNAMILYMRTKIRELALTEIDPSLLVSMKESKEDYSEEKTVSSKHDHTDFLNVNVFNWK